MRSPTRSTSHGSSNTRSTSSSCISLGCVWGLCHGPVSGGRALYIGIRWRTDLGRGGRQRAARCPAGGPPGNMSRSWRSELVYGGEPVSRANCNFRAFQMEELLLHMQGASGKPPLHVNRPEVTPARVRWADLAEFQMIPAKVDSSSGSSRAAGREMGRSGPAMQG